MCWLRAWTSTSDTRWDSEHLMKRDPESCPVMWAGQWTQKCTWATGLTRDHQVHQYWQLYLKPSREDLLVFDLEAFLQDMIVQREDAVIKAVLREVSQWRQESIKKIIIIIVIITTITSQVVSQERKGGVDFCGFFSLGSSSWKIRWTVWFVCSLNRRRLGRCVVE